MNTKISILLSLFSLSYYAQSGPGGVGSSTNNPLWLQADDISISDGSAISSWSDRSGNGNDASQATAAYQATYETSEVNGHDVVRFDGTDDYFDDNRTYDARTFFSVYNILSANQKTSDLGQIWGSYSEGWHVSLDARSGGGTWSFDGAPALNSGNTGKLALNGANYGGFSGNPGSPKWTYNQFDLVSVEFNTTRTLTRQVLGSLIPHFTVGAHQYGGDVAEIIVYNTVLNDAQRIIVENFLAARYGLNIANDKYSHQGTFGNEVAGIGRVDASNLHQDAQGTSIVRINTPSDLDDNEFLLWGHNNVHYRNGAYESPWLGELPTGVNNSLHRVWRADETGGDVGTVNVMFNVSDLAIGSTSDLVLLMDSDDGDFKNATVIPLSSFSAPYATFSGVDISLGSWFTLGSTTTFNSLPIELVNFNVQAVENKVDLSWQTASEINNDYFSIERSQDGVNWETTLTMEGAGNSSSLLNYKTLDTNPLSGTSFYRLKQTDFDGQFTYSKVETITLNNSFNNDVLVYPNPTNNKITVVSDQKEMEQILVLNSLGQDVTRFTSIENQNTTTCEIDLSNLSKGVYFVRTKTNVTKVSKN